MLAERKFAAFSPTGAHVWDNGHHEEVEPDIITFSAIISACEATVEVTQPFFV